MLVLGVWTIVGLLLIVIDPLRYNDDRIFRVALIAAIVWLLPGALFGVSVPLIRRSFNTPRLWSSIAFLAAGVLLITTLILVRGEWVSILLTGSLLLMVGGLLFRRYCNHENWREYWPLAALSIAVLACCLNSIIQTTIRDAFVAFHDANKTELAVVVPDGLTPEARASLQAFQQEFLDYFTPQKDSLLASMSPTPERSAAEQLQIVKESRKWLVQDRAHFLEVTNQYRDLDKWWEQARELKKDLDEGTLPERWQKVTVLWSGTQRTLANIDSVLDIIEQLRSNHSSRDSTEEPKIISSDIFKEELKQLNFESKKLKSEEEEFVRELDHYEAHFKLFFDSFPANQRGTSGKNDHKDHAGKKPGLEAKLDEVQLSVAQLLEICIVGGFSVWVLAGLIAAWNIFNEKNQFHS